MSGRRLLLDDGPGEARGVVLLDGRPERLLIDRADDSPMQRLGARIVARVRRVERAMASAFLDLGEGPDAVLALAGDAADVTEGAWIEIEIAGEARHGKGATARLVGHADGPQRLTAPAPSLNDRLRTFAPGAAIEQGAVARDAADAAEAAVLAVVHPLPGGGSLAVEPTRALTAVDVDLGARAGRGGDARRAARAANLAAIAETARLLRLKGLGGLVVIDLAGKGHDGAAMSAQAKAAFAADGAGVVIGPISRFGALELVAPRTGRPTAERLCDPGGRLSAATAALRLLRALEREGRADPGGRLSARCSTEVEAAARPYIDSLTARIGPRFALVGEAGRAREDMEVSTA